jgi:NADH-quinone oxidoreductase subunit J
MTLSFIEFLFYFFSTILVLSALTVVSTRNTVHAVMFLVLAFLNAAALFVILGAEFIAMLLIVVYVGAIAVLFLFVVMMLDVDHKKIKGTINKNLPILIIISLIMLAEIIAIIKFSSVKWYDTKTLFPTPKGIHNINAIGDVLYTDFILPFQISGAVLFVAMIGAIVLTLKSETRFIRKQKISDQVYRNKENSMEVVQVQSGKGIDL